MVRNDALIPRWLVMLMLEKTRWAPLHKWESDVGKEEIECRDGSPGIYPSSNTSILSPSPIA